MNKLFGFLGGGKIGIIMILSMVCGLIWFGVAFNKRGNKLDEAKKSIEVLNKENEKLLGNENNLKKDIFKCKQDADIRAEDDSLNFAQREVDLQKVIRDLKADRDYWKDFAEKLETGDFCVEYKGLFKRKKVLGPCRE